MDWTLLITTYLTPEAVAVVIGAIFAFMARRKWIKDEHAKKLDEKVGGAVTAVYHEFVQDIKAGGGKLTDEQKKEARARAISKIKEAGLKEGIDFIKEYGVDYIVHYIEKKVQG